MTSETKQCTKCGVVKPATAEYFYVNSQYLRSDCKVCVVEQRKAYCKANKEVVAEQKKAHYEANKEAILEQRKAYYEANKEAILERNKAYYEANKEAILEQAKVYREANKEAILEQRKAYYEANKEAILEQRKAYREANKDAYKTYYEANKETLLEKKKVQYRTPKGKFIWIKRKAKERSINFSLSFDLYENQLWGKPCHYCGCVLEVTGLDRKDSDKGYTPDNVVPCCWGCNTKKNTKPYEEFIAEVKNER